MKTKNRETEKSRSRKSKIRRIDQKIKTSKNGEIGKTKNKKKAKSKYTEIE